jgi:aconitate hydratase
MRIVLESVLRHCDRPEGHGRAHVAPARQWQPDAPRSEEIPFVVARVVLQDFTGVPLLADLAAMRNVAARMGRDPKRIEPLVPVDLVVDHSVMIDHFGTKKALDLNMKLEFQRNQRALPVHEVGHAGLRAPSASCRRASASCTRSTWSTWRAACTRDAGQVYYPDSLVGTDSHTTMINGIGVVGWGVGGIEAEAGMLGQPVYFLTPDVVGFELTGRLREGVTATDLVLTVTEILRREKVVGKFVEFFGEGTRTLALPDRATIANMAPEYGATMGFFPVDEKTVEYFRGTGRSARARSPPSRPTSRRRRCSACRWPATSTTQRVVRLDLSTVAPSLAGPKRPQDRIEIGNVKTTFADSVQQAHGRQRLQPGRRQARQDVHDRSGSESATAMC